MTRYVNVMIFAKGGFFFGLILFGAGAAWGIGYMVLPYITKAGYDVIGPYGDYVGGTIGTAVALMNTGAFLVLTYVIGATQQRSHDQQITLQYNQHMFQFRMNEIEQLENLLRAAENELNAIVESEDIKEAIKNHRHWFLCSKLNRKIGQLINYWPYMNDIIRVVEHDITHASGKISDVRYSADEVNGEYVQGQVSIIVLTTLGLIETLREATFQRLHPTDLP